MPNRRGGAYAAQIEFGRVKGRTDERNLRKAATQRPDIKGELRWRCFRWIAEFQSERKRMPSVQEVKDFCATYQEEELSDLRDKASGIIFSLGEELVSEREEEIREAAFNARTVQEIERLNAAIEKISGYKHHIVGHIAGFFCLVILYVALTWAVDHEPSVVRFLTGHT